MSQDLSWFSEAACKGQSELFYEPPMKETSQVRRKRERSAVVICNSCPVKDLCRQYGRDNGELGIWGGETETERWSAGYLKEHRIFKSNRSLRKISHDVGRFAVDSSDSVRV